MRAPRKTKAAGLGVGARTGGKKSPAKSSLHFNHMRPMPARIFREIRNDDGHVVGIEPWMPVGAAFAIGGAR